MKRKLIGILKGFVFFMPFIIATVGFLMELQDGILNAMYRAMRLYMVEMDCEYADVNILIEIARWTAPVMSAAAILAALSSAFGWMRNFVRVRRKGAVAIHGDSENAASLADSLGKRAVLGEKSVNRVAPNQVLMFREDREMLDYLNANREKLFHHDNKVYLCTEHLVRSNFSNRNLIVCNYPEICARYYWKEHPLRYHSGERTIVLIGFGGYGQEILTQALLRNVYAPDSRITYHVFGDSSQYLGCHAELSQIVSLGEDGQGDRVCFHQEPWFSCGDVISCADRIILAQDEEVDNLMTMNLLERYYLTGAIHIKVNDSRNLKDFSNAVIPLPSEIGEGALYAWDPHGRLCAIAWERELMLVDQAGMVTCDIELKYAAASMTFSPDGQTILLVDHNNFLRRYSLDGSLLSSTKLGDERFICAFENARWIFPDNGEIILATPNGINIVEPKEYKLQTTSFSTCYGYYQGKILSNAFRGDGSEIGYYQRYTFDQLVEMGKARVEGLTIRNPEQYGLE